MFTHSINHEIELEQFLESCLSEFAMQAKGRISKWYEPLRIEQEMIDAGGCRYSIVGVRTGLIREEWSIYGSYQKAGIDDLVSAALLIKSSGCMAEREMVRFVRSALHLDGKRFKLKKSGERVVITEQAGKSFLAMPNSLQTYTGNYDIAVVYEVCGTSQNVYFTYEDEGKRQKHWDQIISRSRTHDVDVRVVIKPHLESEETHYMKVL